MKPYGNTNPSEGAAQAPIKIEPRRDQPNKASSHPLPSPRRQESSIKSEGGSTASSSITVVSSSADSASAATSSVQNTFSTPTYFFVSAYNRNFQFFDIPKDLQPSQLHTLHKPLSDSFKALLDSRLEAFASSLPSSLLSTVFGEDGEALVSESGLLSPGRYQLHDSFSCLHPSTGVGSAATRMESSPLPSFDSSSFINLDSVSSLEQYLFLNFAGKRLADFPLLSNLLEYSPFDAVEAADLQISKFFYEFCMCAANGSVLPHKLVEFLVKCISPMCVKHLELFRQKFEKFSALGSRGGATALNEGVREVAFQDLLPKKQDELEVGSDSLITTSPSFHEVKVPRNATQSQETGAASYEPLDEPMQKRVKLEVARVESREQSDSSVKDWCASNDPPAPSKTIAEDGDSLDGSNTAALTSKLSAPVGASVDVLVHCAPAEGAASADATPKVDDAGVSASAAASGAGPAISSSGASSSPAISSSAPANSSSSAASSSIAPAHSSSSGSSSYGASTQVLSATTSIVSQQFPTRLIPPFKDMLLDSLHLILELLDTLPPQSAQHSRSRTNINAFINSLIRENAVCEIDVVAFLDPVKLDSIGFTRREVKGGLQGLNVRDRTKRLYMLTTHNLMRENSIGYGKLITCLNEFILSDEKIDYHHCLKFICDIVGNYSLCPSRTLGIILDFFERSFEHCSVNQLLPVVSIFSSYKITEVICFQLHLIMQASTQLKDAAEFNNASTAASTAATGASKEKTAGSWISQSQASNTSSNEKEIQDFVATESSEGFYLVLSILISKGLCDLSKIYTFLEPSDAVLSDSYKLLSNVYENETRGFGLHTNAKDSAVSTVGVRVYRAKNSSADAALDRSTGTEQEAPESLPSLSQEVDFFSKSPSPAASIKTAAPDSSLKQSSSASYLKDEAILGVDRKPLSALTTTDKTASSATPPSTNLPPTKRRAAGEASTSPEELTTSFTQTSSQASPRASSKTEDVASGGSSKASYRAKEVGGSQTSSFVNIESSNPKAQPSSSDLAASSSSTLFDSLVSSGANKANNRTHTYKQMIDFLHSSSLGKLQFIAALLKVNAWKVAEILLKHLKRIGCRPEVNSIYQDAMGEYIRWLIHPLVRCAEGSFLNFLSKTVSSQAHSGNSFLCVNSFVARKSSVLPSEEVIKQLSTKQIEFDASLMPFYWFGFSVLSSNLSFSELEQAEKEEANSTPKKLTKRPLVKLEEDAHSSRRGESAAVSSLSAEDAENQRKAEALLNPRKTIGLQPCVSMDAFFEVLMLLMPHIGYFIYTNIPLIREILQVIGFFVEESGGRSFSKSVLDHYFEYLDFLFANILFPALAHLIEGHCQVGDELWKVLCKFPTSRRYEIYSRYSKNWLNSENSPILLIQESVKARIRKILKRTTSDMLKDSKAVSVQTVIAELTGLAATNPFQVVEIVLSQCEMFDDNMVYTLTESMKHVNSLTSDIFAYALIQRQQVREQFPGGKWDLKYVEASGYFKPKRLSNLSQLTGRFFRRHPSTDLRPILLSSIYRLCCEFPAEVSIRIGNSTEVSTHGKFPNELGGYFLDKDYVERLIELMGGVPKIPDAHALTMDQIYAQGGGAILRSEVLNSVDGDYEFGGLAYRKLAASLFDRNIVRGLMLTLAKQRLELLFDSECNISLKLLGASVDDIHRFQLQLVNFLRFRLDSSQQYMKVIPTIPEIFKFFEQAVAWFIVRPCLRPIYEDDLAPSGDNSEMKEAEGNILSSDVCADSTELNSLLISSDNEPEEGDFEVVEIQQKSQTDDLTAQEENLRNFLFPIISSHCEAKEIAGVPADFYFTFWRLSLSDICVPQEQYQKMFDALEFQIKQNPQPEKEDSRQHLRRLKKLRWRQAELKNEWDSLRKKHEFVIARLTERSKVWLGGSSSDSTALSATEAVVKHMISPRLFVCEEDALFCAFFSLLLFQLQVPFFNFYSFFNDWTRMIIPSIGCCTEHEALMLGIFVNEMLRVTKMWLSNDELYSQIYKDNPCFLISTQKAKITCNHKNLKLAVKKWENKIMKPIRSVLSVPSDLMLSKGDWMSKKTIILFLSRCHENFPVHHHVGVQLKEDLRLLADAAVKTGWNDIQLSASSLVNTLERHEQGSRWLKIPQKNSATNNQTSISTASNASSRKSPYSEASADGIDKGTFTTAENPVPQSAASPHPANVHTSNAVLDSGVGGSSNKDKSTPGGGISGTVQSLKPKGIPGNLYSEVPDVKKEPRGHSSAADTCAHQGMQTFKETASSSSRATIPPESSKQMDYSKSARQSEQAEGNVSQKHDTRIKGGEFDAYSEGASDPYIGKKRAYSKLSSSYQNVSHDPVYAESQQGNYSSRQPSKDAAMHDKSGISPKFHDWEWTANSGWASQPIHKHHSDPKDFQSGKNLPSDRSMLLDSGVSRGDLVAPDYYPVMKVKPPYEEYSRPKRDFERDAMIMPEGAGGRMSDTYVGQKIRDGYHGSEDYDNRMYRGSRRPVRPFEDDFPVKPPQNASYMDEFIEEKRRRYNVFGGAGGSYGTLAIHSQENESSSHRYPDAKDSRRYRMTYDRSHPELVGGNITDYRPAPTNNESRNLLPGSSRASYPSRAARNVFAPPTNDFPRPNNFDPAPKYNH